MRKNRRKSVTPPLPSSTRGKSARDGGFPLEDEYNKPTNSFIMNVELSRYRHMPITTFNPRTLKPDLFIFPESSGLHFHSNALKTVSIVSLKVSQNRVGDSAMNLELPLNKIICGDSEDELKKLMDNSVDIIITSPPYNRGMAYKGTSDSLTWEKYFKKLFIILDECIRVLKHGGRLIINIQPAFSEYIPTHHMISIYLKNKQLLWKGEILWEKNNYNCMTSCFGSYKSPSSPYLKYTWEFIEIYCKGTRKHTGLKENIDIERDEFLNWVNVKWSIAPEKRMKKFEHPAMFPEELVKRLLKLFSYKEDVILDPFNGAGTTTYVAKKMGRNYIGIDASSEYCQIAEERLLQIPAMVSQ
jgi:DNA modification methylase